MLAVSSVTRDQLIELFGLPADRVKVAHTGVPDTFLDMPENGPSEDLRLVFLGNLSEEKGPYTALDVVERLNVTTPAALRYVGSGPLRGALEEETTLRGLSDRIEFVGSVADVRSHLAWADLLVLTSETEGFPGVVLEAAATGTPAAAFAVGGTAETIEDGVTGVVVEAGDVPALVEALRSLAVDQSRIDAMGTAARARVRDGFLIEHAVDRHDRLLSDLIGVQPHDEAAISA